MKILSSLKHKVVGGVAVAVAAVAIAVPTTYAADYWTSTFVSEDYDYSSAEAISYRTVGVWAEAVQDLSIRDYKAAAPGGACFAEARGSSAYWGPNVDYARAGRF
ncbi:hypothetical protein H6A68_08495 [Bifidobacterium pullorum subsp. saeculare]|uniref:hypothetical protein n=1 Tax=Bifidobacterium pullorum TaxID=78448 RepID=UPI001957943C|nr:hypothetical protein [Bifidobacterium pullorum]MBM6707072.1 hypothetical protein [Bifidobacterium pullorum subsp. saeculare]